MSNSSFQRAVVVVAAVIAAVAVIWAVQSLRGSDDQATAVRPGGGDAISVITAPAIERTAVDFIESIGTARANKAVVLTSKVTGRLDEILFRDGEEVTEGQVLLRLDAADLVAELQNAEATFKRTQQDYDRALPLRGSQAVSQARVDELMAAKDEAEALVEARKARLEEFTISAPFDGTVGVNRLSRGTLIRPETQITTLDDLRVIKVDFAIPETIIQRIASGDRIIATSRAFEGAKIEGTIQSLETRVDPVNRTIGTVAVFDNKERLLRPGMFLNLRISLDERPGAIFVAEEALAPAGGRQYVFVVDQGIAVRREVEIGLREPGLVEIRRGVKAGEQLVVRGTQFVRDGSPVVVQEIVEPGRAPTYQPS